MSKSIKSRGQLRFWPDKLSYFILFLFIFIWIESRFWLVILTGFLADVLVSLGYKTMNEITESFLGRDRTETETETERKITKWKSGIFCTILNPN